MYGSDVFSRLLTPVLHRQVYVSLIRTITWEPSQTVNIFSLQTVWWERELVGQNPENLLTLRIPPVCQKKHQVQVSETRAH